VPVANPLELTVAIDCAEELQLAVLLRFCVVPLLKVPVAVNCCEIPAATDAVAGVTAIDVNTAAVTAKVAEPMTVPDLAVIVVDPCDAAVAKPAVLTVATEVFDELQVAVLIRFCLVPLL